MHTTDTKPQDHSLYQNHHATFADWQRESERIVKAIREARLELEPILQDIYQEISELALRIGAEMPYDPDSEEMGRPLSNFEVKLSALIERKVKQRFVQVGQGRDPKESGYLTYEEYLGLMGLDDLQIRIKASAVAGYAVLPPHVTLLVTGLLAGEEKSGIMGQA